MKKLLRFIIVSLLFVLTFMLFYSLLPLVVWIFGGSFTVVSQSVPYVAFCAIIMLPLQSIIFGECFDSNFYPKD
jgi:cytochrome c biogenesis protein CcdA